jgi:hypothetical protein
VIEFIVILANAANICWSVSGLVVGIAKDRGYIDHPHLEPFRWLWAELRPFFLPATGIMAAWVIVHGEMTPVGAVIYGMNVAAWFAFKDIDKDDRWKRRRAKLAAKIERRGSRLVAVPLGGES